MKSKYYFYIEPVIMAFLFSCEKEIKFKGDEIKTKLVLNGLLTSDSIVKINLTESRFFLNDDGIFKKINNATVELWKDGNKIENLSNAGEGYYAGTYLPKIGDNLRITASCEGFDPVECSTGIVAPTPIISVDTMNLKEERGYYYHYSIKVYLKYYYSNGENFSFPVYYVSDDMVFQTGNEMGFLEDDGDYMESTVFSDELFDGKEYKLKIKTRNWNAIYVGNNSYDPDNASPELVGKEISVELQSLSSSYYLYQKTREASFNGNDPM